MIVMLEYDKENIDIRKCSGMLLTDLSKAFDCLLHDLLIAKHNAKHSQLSSDRKQRIKIDEAYSSWIDIILASHRDQSWAIII